MCFSIAKRVTSALAALALLSFLAADTYAQQRPPSNWTPASPSNYTVGRGGNSIRYVVIHITEGSFQGAVSWFQNPAAHVSAHYVISRTGQVDQCVRESDTAWHAGNWSYNQQAIGIEHEGMAEYNSWTDVQYRTSAQMTSALCAAYGIPRDRTHIIGHYQVPGNDHPGCPGAYFNWTYYMQLVGGGGGNPPPPPPPGLTAQQVATSVLNVRTGPGGGYAIIGTVGSGQIYASNSSSNGWYQIFFDNRTGWSYGGYLTRRTGVSGRRVSLSSLNVRTGPGTGYSLVGTCQTPEVFITTGSSGSWSQIWYRGAARWFYTPYTSAVQF